MKSFTTVLFCSVLLARSSLAIPTVDHVEAEKILQQRQRDLQNDTPLNEEERASLKWMLSRRTLRFNDEVSNNQQSNRRRLTHDKYANNALANAMRKSALAKVKTERRAGRRKLRGEKSDAKEFPVKNAKEVKAAKEVKDAKDDKEVKDKSISGDEASAKTKIEETISWLNSNSNPSAGKEEYEEKEVKEARAAKDSKDPEKTKDNNPLMAKELRVVKDTASKNPDVMKESKVIRTTPEFMKPPSPGPKPKPANHDKRSQMRETPTATSIGGAMEGRMVDGNELSTSTSTTRSGTTRSGTTRSGRYRNAYYDYNGNGNGGNNNGYYEYDNNGGNNIPQDPVEEEEIFVPQSRAETPEKVSMVLEAFQDSRMLAEPVYADESYLAPGTQYLFSNEPLYNVVFDVPPNAEDNHRPAYLVNERDKIAEVSGECIRTDPKIKYAGKAYCQFEYRFLDSKGNVEASLTASGPVSKGDIDTLSITGGSGIFRRTVGTVILETGSIRRGSPPMFVPDDSRDLPSSYLVKMFVFLDSVDVELARSSR